MVDVVFPYISFLKKLVLRNHWPTKDRLGKIKVPILLIMSLLDELVPSSHMRKLKELAIESSRVDEIIIERGKHNDNWFVDRHKYFSGIKRFID